MIKDLIYKMILFTGILPASILLFFSLIGFATIIIDNILDGRNIIILISIIFGIVGYVGLITSMIFPRKALLNFILLLLGLIGFSIFLSYEAGLKGWKWLVTIEEPEEWFLPGLPFVATVIGLIVNLKESIKNKSN